MLRHSTGYKLANDGHDTRALQHYMGHRNIMHTVRYTEMAPDRFKNFWKESRYCMKGLVVRKLLVEVGR